MNSPKPMQYPEYRLLIVEDEEINRFVLEKILRAEKWNFTFASSGEEALVLFQNATFDFVLLDIELPGMNGYETALAIRKLKSCGNSQPIILAMTGHPNPEESEKTIGCGINGWIVKPFGMEQLKTAIQKTMGQSAEVKTRPVIHLDLLNQIAGDDPAFIRICIELFLREMPENLQRLNTGIANCDWETIRTTSHKMKTSLNYMGMDEHRLAAVNIEKLAREKRDLDCIKSNAQLVTSGCKKAFEELKDIILKNEEANP